MVLKKILYSDNSRQNVNMRRVDLTSIYYCINFFSFFENFSNNCYTINPMELEE